MLEYLAEALVTARRHSRSSATSIWRAGRASWAGRIAGLPGYKAPFDLLSMADAEIG